MLQAGMEVDQSHRRRCHRRQHDWRRLQANAKQIPNGSWDGVRFAWGVPAPNERDARSNPRTLGDFDSTTRAGLMRSSAVGADGKIYFGSFGLRHYTGGGFGWPHWVDPS